MRALLVVLGLLAIPTEADACKCAKQTYADQVKAATQVVLVRAGAPATKDDHVTQTFTVLATWKGAAQKQLRVDRLADVPCSTSYAENEVAILFWNGTGLGPCQGNTRLSSQIEGLEKILDATGTKRATARAPAIEAALRHTLAKYTHDRASIWVRHPPLAKTSFQIGTSKLTFTKGAYKREIRILKAIAADAITFVEGTYNREGLRFSALVHDDTVVWASVAER